MRTFSIGSVVVGALRERRDNIKVRQPTLPRYIKMVRTISEPIERKGVMPRVNPTVPIAEKTSKTTEEREDTAELFCSKRQIKMTPREASRR